MRVHLHKILCFIYLTVSLPSTHAQTNGLPPAQPKSAPMAFIAQRYARIPLAFEANQGQFDSQVKFISRGAGYNLFLTSTEAVLVLQDGSVSQPSSSTEEFALPPNGKTCRPSDEAAGCQSQDKSVWSR